MTNPKTSQSNQALDALGNETRREILYLLQTEPKSVIQIANAFPISRPAISKHLKILKKAKLVKHETEGVKNIFSIDLKGFDEARVYLDAFWDETLSSFQKFADNHDR